MSGPEGYEVESGIADDNLRVGRTVIVDSVNPIEVTRAAWRGVAKRAGRRYVEIEVVCSNRAEHRRRVETRTADIAGHQFPAWQEVCEREYERWEAGIVVDTAGRKIKASVPALRGEVAGIEPAFRAGGDKRK